MNYLLLVLEALQLGLIVWICLKTWSSENEIWGEIKKLWSSMQDLSCEKYECTTKKPQIKKPTVSKLSKADVSEIKELWESGYPADEIADLFGTSVQTIYYHVKKGKK